MNTPNILKRHLKRAFDILLHQGPKAFLGKVKLKIKESKRIELPRRTEEERIPFHSSSGEPECDMTLAVHIHLFYDDLADEFISALKNIPIRFDLFISVREAITDDRLSELSELFKSCCDGQVTIERAPNRGRDIAPMFSQFASRLMRYDLVLHMHSKKSLYTGTEQKDWRTYSVDALIGSSERAADLLRLISERKDIGIVYPKRFSGMAPEAYGWLSNEKKGRDFLESMGIPFSGGIFLYPAGSFYLVRNDAIRQIWNRRLNLNDFDEEMGQTDGTLAHVIERAVSIVSRYNGYCDAIIDMDDKSFHIGSDIDTFSPVLARGYDHVFTDLASYDIVSFDMFDTLVTRKIKDAGELFSYIPLAASGLLDGNLLSDCVLNTACDDSIPGQAGTIKDIAGLYGISIDESITDETHVAIKKIISLGRKAFRDIRISAELDAIDRYGDRADIYKIYECMRKYLKPDGESEKILLTAELWLEEECIIPRREMCDLLNRLIDNGSHVIITTDMYLPEDFIKRILNKFNIRYEHLYLSCAEGKRKDDGSMWDMLLEKYKGRTFAHTGDNQQSDWQTLSDRGEKTVWIMSPGTEKRINGFDAGAGAGTFSEELMVQGGLFNSPFSICPDGAIHIRSTFDMGYSIFGPLIYEYMKWLHGIEGDQILFLAREGWIFKKIYEIIYGSSDRNIYLLASRRAVSVAAIRSMADVEEILGRAYDGSLHNILDSRLGMPGNMIKNFKDRQIHIEDGGIGSDYRNIINDLKPFEEEILEYAGKERENYLAYLDGIGISDGDVMADIGYSGTIQYYMTKLLGHPTRGAYLAVFKENKKLLDLGSEVHAMYMGGRDDFSDVIKDTQLYLESVLKAPYGQLLCFNDDGEPVYKDEAPMSIETSEIQEGMIRYAMDRSSSEKIMAMDNGSRDDEADRKFMERAYRYLLIDHDVIDHDLSSVFSVEDSYSQDTRLHLDPSTGRWVI